MTSLRLGAPERATVPPRTLRRTCALLFAAAAGILVGWVWQMGQGFGVFSDEWNIAILANRGRLLEPFNGHLSLVPQLLYLALSRSAGLAHYAPYRIAGLVPYVLLGGLVGVHASRRATPVVGVIAGVAVLWSSAAQLTLLFPLLVNFTVPLCCCVGIWLLLDAPRPRDSTGAALLGIALASSAVGLVTAATVCIELVSRRVGWRRALPYGVPIVAWFGWWLAFHTSTARPGGPGALASFAGREALASFAALCGGWTPGGWMLIVLFVLLTAVAAFRWHTFDARAAAALTGFVVFVALTSIGREGIGSNGLPLPAIEPTTNRYLFVNGVFLLSAAASMAGPSLQRASGRSGRRFLQAAVVAAAVPLLVVNAWSLAGDVRTYRHDQLAYQRGTRTVLLGTRLAGSRAKHDRVIPINFIPVTAGAYLELVSKVPHAPLPSTTAGLGRQDDRALADSWLVADLDLALGPLRRSFDGCHPRRGSPITVVPGTHVVVAAGERDTEVAVARLADASHATRLGMVPAAQTREIAFPPGPGERLPWLVVVRGGPASLSACR